jgi:hypothetical protein
LTPSRVQELYAVPSTEVLRRRAIPHRPGAGDCPPGRYGRTKSNAGGWCDFRETMRAFCFAWSVLFGLNSCVGITSADEFDSDSRAAAPHQAVAAPSPAARLESERIAVIYRLWGEALSGSITPSHAKELFGGTWMYLRDHGGSPRLAANAGNDSTQLV